MAIDSESRLVHDHNMRILALILYFPLSGCVAATVASTAVDIATLPVKAAAAGVDAVTTSQSEADERRGRELRKAAERCRKGKPRAGDDCAAIAALQKR